jgi:hypothetical protein
VGTVIVTSGCSVEADLIEVLVGKQNRKTNSERDSITSDCGTTTGLTRCSNGAATSLHFTVLAIPNRNTNRLAPTTTELGEDTAIRGSSD